MTKNVLNIKLKSFSPRMIRPGGKNGEIKMGKEKDFEKEENEEEEVISITEDDREEAGSSEKTEKTIETKEIARPRKKGKPKLALFIILIVLLMGGLIGGGIYLWQKNKNKVEHTNETTAPPKEDTEKAAEPKEEAGAVYVGSLVGLNMRKTASLTAEIVTVLKYGTKLTVEKEEGSFYFGKDESGNEGYFAKEFTSKTDPLSEWITYNGKSYTAKYPKDWLKKTCEDSVSAGFGPDEASLQLCNSEKFALVTITTMEGTKAEYIDNTKSGLDTFTESNITVSGTDAVRLEGKTKEAEVGPQKGSVSISVVLESGSDIVVLSYMQSPSGTDYSDIFDLMVENFSLAG